MDGSLWAEGTLPDIGMQLGDRVTLGDRVKLGDWVKLGDEVKLGDGVKLGDWVKLGNGVTLGNGVRLGDGVTSAKLAQDFRNFYISAAPSHIFSKWLTPERRSPNFDGGTPLHYPVGATMDSTGTASDQQCAPGLHVLRQGHRPEWYGLCSPDHNLIAVDVEVRSEDILFAGLPTNEGKFRVKKLKVLT